MVLHKAAASHFRNPYIDPAAWHETAARTPNCVFCVRELVLADMQMHLAARARIKIAEHIWKCGTMWNEIYTTCL